MFFNYKLPNCSSVVNLNFLKFSSEIIPCKFVIMLIKTNVFYLIFLFAYYYLRSGLKR